MRSKNNVYLRQAFVGAIAFLVLAVVAFAFFLGNLRAVSAGGKPNTETTLWIEIAGCLMVMAAAGIYVSLQNAREENRMFTIGDWNSLDSSNYPREADIDLPIHPGRAFRLGRLAIQLLPSWTICAEDPVAGTVYATAEALGTGLSTIRLTIEKTEGNTSRVHIESAYPLVHKPEGMYIGTKGMPRDNGQNEKFIKTIADYLLEQAGRVPADMEEEQQFRAAPGSFSYTGESAETNPFYKDPRKSAFLSLIPGLGQEYNGMTVDGLVIALGTGAFLMVAIIPGVLVWLYGIGAAYSSAHKMNGELIPFRHTSVPAMLLTAVFALVCLTAAYYVIGVFGTRGLVPLFMNPVSTCLRVRCI